MSVGLFGYIYLAVGGDYPDYYDFMVFACCVAFSAIYVLAVTAIRLLKAVRLRQG